MKRLQRILDRVRPSFAEGGRFAVLEPVFEAMESLLFAPSAAARVAPFGRDPLDMKRLMLTVVIALTPCLVMSLYFFGLRVISIIAVSYVVGGAVEVAFAIIRKEKICEGFLVTGVLFSLILPPALPLPMVAVGIAFGVFVGKELFGGTARNLFNPAIVGRCFLALAYPAATTQTWVKPGAAPAGRLLEYVTTSDVNAITMATPLGLAKQGNFADVSLADLFIGNVPGCVGETSAIAIIIGGVFLLSTRVANWRTVAGALGSFVVLAGALHHNDPQRFGPVLWQLCAGGFLFGAFFMATDPVTSPITNPGKWIYGAIIGAACILIRNFTGYVEGVMFAILLGNIVAPILDEIVFAIRIRRLQHEG